MDSLEVCFTRNFLHTVSFKERLKDERLLVIQSICKQKISFAAVEVCAIKSIPGLSFSSNVVLSPQCLPVGNSGFLYMEPRLYTDFRCLFYPCAREESKLETRKNRKIGSFESSPVQHSIRRPLLPSVEVVIFMSQDISRTGQEQVSENQTHYQKVLKQIQFSTTFIFRFPNMANIELIWKRPGI